METQMLEDLEYFAVSSQHLDSHTGALTVFLEQDGACGNPSFHLAPQFLSIECVEDRRAEIP
jgi:hypothetical protein